jgi:hypothetical protein
MEGLIKRLVNWFTNSVAEIATTFGPKMVANFRTQYKSIQNLQILQGYIFRILNHFVTKLCNLLILVCSFYSYLFASPCLV